jgi:hypothetical protein
MSTPCKVYYARPGKDPKVLTARTAEELAALLRIGWKTEKPSK